MKPRMLAAIIPLVVVVGLGACGNDEPEPRSKPAKSPPPPTVVDASPPPTPSAEAPGGASSPTEAAQTLHDHWVEGDSIAALETATQQAVNELFAHPGNPLDFQGCIREGSDHTCFFYYEGGGLNMIVGGSPAEGYLVTKAFFVAD